MIILHGILIARHGNYSTGNCVVIKTTIEGVSSIEISHGWIQRWIFILCQVVEAQMCTMRNIYHISRMIMEILHARN